MTKPEIRALVKTRRIEAAHLPDAERQAAAAALLENLRKLEVWRNARRPCAYVALPGEAPTDAVLADCFRRTGTSAGGVGSGGVGGVFTLSLPRVNSAATGDLLDLCAVSCPDALAPGTFGILEPTAACTVIAPADCDCILVPGVAFDETGGRVGRGRGFYDRLFSRHPAVPRIGLAWDWQVFASVPMEPHDAQIHWLVTPTRVLAFPLSQAVAVAAT
jgi:5-formyltetrahydrofolate cyclo-ligase